MPDSGENGESVSCKKTETVSATDSGVATLAATYCTAEASDATSAKFSSPQPTEAVSTLPVVQRNSNDPVYTDPVLCTDPVTSPDKWVGAPNKQRNSSEFTFSRSLRTPRHRIVNFPEQATTNSVRQTDAIASCGSETKRNKDSLPEFSVDLDHVTATSVARGGACVTPSLKDFCSSAIASSQDVSLSRSHTCNSAAASVSSSVGSLEPVLGKERLQRLLRNLRDIDLVSSPSDQHHQLDSSESGDQRWARKSSSTHEARTSATHEVATSGLRDRSRLEAGSALCEPKTDGVGDLEAGGSKPRSSFALVLHDLSSAEVRSQHREHRYTNYVGSSEAGVKTPKQGQVKTVVELYLHELHH